jgi:hypothetical protein
MIDYTPAGADARHAMVGGDERIIPQGSYCYSVIGFVENENGIPSMNVKPCPYWGLDKDQPEQMGGYCAMLKSGDWHQGGTILLWDQVKECGLNERTEEEEDAYQATHAKMRENPAPFDGKSSPS